MKNIEEVLDQYNVVDYSINNDGSVNLTKDITFFKKNLDKIPFNISKAPRVLDFSFNNISSLEGSPEECDTIFYAMNNISDLTGVTITSRLLSLSNNKIEKINFPKEFKTNELLLNHNNIYELTGIPINFNGKIFLNHNPIATCFKTTDGKDVHVFNSLKIIKDKKVNLKRLKYFNDIIKNDKPIDVEEIKKYYEII
tara:strand:- start:1053 stop:1643 length:591 start_codon:yes stop_codon:yes gene_type:complete